ncbi:putative ATP-dependent helicase IRC3 [Coemansia spiralis]|nr:putative ATP-dependent helicase IRC3 [Coemansia spiralis]
MRLEFPSRGGKKSYATSEKELGMEADSLEQAIHAIDTLLRHEMPWSALMAAQRTAGWRGRPPSPAQLKQLRRLGVALPDDADACAGASKARPGQRLTRGVAANLIQRAIGGCGRAWRDFEAAKARIASDEDSILAEAMRNAAWITPASDA